MLLIDKIGIKSIKIAVAVTMALLIGNIFKLGSPYLMALTSVIGIQSTMESSVSTAKNMTIGTFLGVSLGIITMKFIANDFIIMTIGVFIIIYICNLLKLQSSVVQASIIYLSIMFFPSPNNNAIGVIVSTIIGIIVAIVVNLLISPFEILNNLNKSYYSLRENIFDLCSKIFSENGEKLDLQEFNLKVMLFKSLFKAYNDEFLKIRNKKLEFNEIEMLYRNIKTINFFIYTIVELKVCYLSEDNIIRINKLLSLDIRYLDNKEREIDCLFNFHVDKLLDSLEMIWDIQEDY